MQQINFALIGCGRIAERHIEAIETSHYGKVVAVCDLDQDRAMEKGAKAKVPYYCNFHEMLTKHPEIRVVILLTPSGIHFEHGMEILTHYQKHLLIEKPFILTSREAHILKNAAEKHQCFIFPVYQNRFNQAVQRVKQAISVDHSLGHLRVGTVRVRWCRPQRYYDLSPWRGTWAMDGGAFSNQGIHFLDLLRYLCGEVKRVHAKLATLGAAIEVEDTGVAILEFANGALGTIEIMTSARPDDFEASLSCVCENGLALIGGIATNELTLFSPDRSQEKMYSETFSNVYGWGHNLIIQNVIDVLHHQAKPLIDFADGLKTIQLLHAIYKSDEQNGWVDVAEPGDSKRLGKADEMLALLYRTPKFDLTVNNKTESCIAN